MEEILSKDEIHKLTSLDNVYDTGLTEKELVLFARRMTFADFTNLIALKLLISYPASVFKGEEDADPGVKFVSQLRKALELVQLEGENSE